MTPASPTTPDTAALDATALRHHGLRTQPFADRTSDGLVYCDPSLDMPVGVLLQRLQTDDKPLLLVGEAGVGKSTQLIQLLSRGTAVLSFCGFKGRAGATFASIAHAIRQQWGHTTTEPATEPAPHPQGDAAPEPVPEDSSLARILLSAGRGKQRPVLVVDDAHLLAPAVLGALLRLRREVNRHCGNTMGIVLAGEPVLNQLVTAAYGEDMPAERQTVIRLRPLTVSQTEAYLRHRLQAAGAPDADLLSGEVAEAIHRESGGLPRDINRVANQHLRELALEPSTETPPRRRDAYGLTPIPGGPHWVAPAAAGAMGVLIGALVASLFFLAGDRNAQHPDADRSGDAAASAPPVPEPAPLPTGHSPAAAEIPPPDAGAPAPQTVPETRLPSVGLVPATLPWQLPRQALLPDGYTSADTGSASGSASGSAPDAAATPATGSVDIQPLEIPPASAGPPVVADDVTTPGDDPAPAPSAAGTTEAVAEDADPEPSGPVKEDIRPEAITEDGASVAAARETPAGPLGPDWVRQRPPGDFTIQIIAGADLDALHRFARRMPIETEVAWFRTRRGEQDWYALVVGAYPDLASARAGAARLPNQVRRNEPWIRTFRSVQQAMDPS
ncbi:MAG: hypothetical protein EA347_07135 [Thioalkalivibrio sp.]|nr:MAG: hypothetical protein EA347_07135 [Thioalkalivibrio sp.]